MNKALIFLGILLAGCSTTGKGYKNPEFASYRMEATAVSVTDASEFGVRLENKIVEELNKRGVKAFATRDMARWAKSHDELLAKIWAKGAKDALVVYYGDGTNVTTGGYQIIGSSTTTGNYTSSSATAVPMRGYSREMATTAFLVTPNGDKIWQANTEKFSSGLLFIGDGSMINGSVNALLDAMREDGLIK